MKPFETLRYRRAERVSLALVMVATVGLSRPGVRSPQAGHRNCEGAPTMYQWREDDTIFDDYGHVGQDWDTYDRNAHDPEGEWYHDGTALVPTEEGHSNWEDSKIADHHEICPPV